MKPSMSNRSRLDFTILHRSDDMYVAFSPVSSYRPHNEDGRMVYWDRPFGTRIDQNFALSDEPINAATIMVKFSADKNIIQILQRNEDNTFVKHSLKTYTPSASADSWTIEITDNIAADNGHIFSWVLNLDPALTPANLSFTPQIISGSWADDSSIAETNGDTITIAPPTEGQYCYNYTVVDDFDCEYTEIVMVGDVHPRTILSSFEYKGKLLKRNYISCYGDEENVKRALIKHFKQHGFKVVEPACNVTLGD